MQGILKSILQINHFVEKAWNIEGIGERFVQVSFTAKYTAIYKHKMILYFKIFDIWLPWYNLQNVIKIQRSEEIFFCLSKNIWNKTLYVNWYQSNWNQRAFSHVSEKKLIKMRQSRNWTNSIISFSVSCWFDSHYFELRMA